MPERASTSVSSSQQSKSGKKSKTSKQPGPPSAPGAISHRVVELITHPDILREIVQHVENDKSQLARLLRVSKAFFSLAGELLYKKLVSKFMARDDPITGFYGSDKSPWSKFALLHNTTHLELFSHGQCDTLSAQVNWEDGALKLNYFNLPKLHTLELHMDLDELCVGFDCLLTRDLRPTKLRLFTQYWWNTVNFTYAQNFGQDDPSISRAPEMLSCVATLDITFGPDSQIFWPQALEILRNHPFPSLNQVNFFVIIAEDYMSSEFEMKRPLTEGCLILADMSRRDPDGYRIIFHFDLCYTQDDIQGDAAEQGKTFFRHAYKKMKDSLEMARHCSGVDVEAFDKRIKLVSEQPPYLELQRRFCPFCCFMHKFPGTGETVTRRVQSEDEEDDLEDDE